MSFGDKAVSGWDLERYGAPAEVAVPLPADDPASMADFIATCTQLQEQSAQVRERKATRDAEFRTAS